MLYVPWRCEDTDILGQFTTYENHYNHVREVAVANEAVFSKHADEIDQAFQDLQEQGAPGTNFSNQFNSSLTFV